jgi:hypothetical protein
MSGATSVKTELPSAQALWQCRIDNVTLEVQGIAFGAIDYARVAAGGIIGRVNSLAG